MNKKFFSIFSFLSEFRGLCFLLLLSLLCIGTVTQAQEMQEEKLRVVTKLFEPFVILNGKNYYDGFSIELWRVIAEKLERKYEFSQVETITELLTQIKNNQADIGIAGISMTAEREKEIDFSYNFFNDAGLQIMVLEKSHLNIISEIIHTLMSEQVLITVGILILILLIAAHLIWMVERHHNPEFSKNYLRGIGDGFWWASVTVATVGYGDKTPKGLVGRIFGIFWIFLGLFIVASFTASVTTSLTLHKLEGKIRGLDDLFGKHVATVQGSTAQLYLFNEIGQRKIQTFSHINKAYQALENEEVVAIVYDAPVLQYHASHEGKGIFKVVGPIFNKESYAIALPTDSPLKEEINRILLDLKEKGIYQKIFKKWFGS